MKHVTHHDRSVRQDPATPNRRFFLFLFCTLAGLLATSAAVDAQEPEGSIDTPLGCPIGPFIESLGRNGGDLLATIVFPPSNEPPVGAWLVQHDATGALVDEIFVDPDVDFESTALIPNGLGVALNRGPSYTLSLLDSQRRPISPPSPFTVKLRCPDPTLCTLEPLLGVAIGTSIHISRALMERLASHIAAGTPIIFDNLVASAPELFGPLVDLFWQASFQESQPGTCECSWFSDTETASLTGGAHLISAYVTAPPPQLSPPFPQSSPPPGYSGASELHTRFACSVNTPASTLPPPIDVGNLVAPTFSLFDSTPCALPCEPLTTHGYTYTAIASAIQRLPNATTATVFNDTDWQFGNTVVSWDPALYQTPTAAAVLFGPTTYNILGNPASRFGDYAVSRFEGVSSITVEPMWSANGVIDSELRMNANSEGCGVVPLRDLELISNPEFDADGCGARILKSIRIGN